MTCEQMADRIVDRLYGELAEDDRPAFEAHLTSCEGCRTQLSALERTRRSAQVALRGPLSLPAPERIRQAAVAAAELHVRQRRSAPAAEASGFWSWLRRPWFLPAFATVSLLALFFITRPMLMDGPRRTLESQLSETLPEETAPAAPAAPEPVTERASERAPEPTFQPARAVSRQGAPAEEAKGATRLADLDDQRRGADPRVIETIADLRQQRLEKSGPAPIRRLAAPAKKMEARAKPAFAEAPPALAPSKEDQAERAVGGLVGGGRARAEAEATSYLVEGARGSAGIRRDLALAEARMKNRRVGTADLPRAFAPPPPAARTAARPFASAAQAPAAAPPPPASAPAPAPAAASERAAAADESDALATGNAAGRGASAGPLALDALIEKADRHYKNEQWQPATDAYRELLRRFPAHERVQLWRQRVQVAATRATAR